MVRITKSGSQFRINIPKEIVELTGWDTNTNLIITPLLKEPSEPINENTPILLKKVVFSKEKTGD